MAQLHSGLRSRISRGLAILAFAWAGTFWIACVAIPVAAILGRMSGIDAGSASFLDPAVLSVVRITLFQAGCSTLISLLIGLPLGLWVGARSALGSRSARVGQALLAIPYAVPTIVAGATAILWLGRSGILAKRGLPLDWAYTLRGVILAHVFLNLSWVALLVAQARAQFPNAQLESARTLGADFSARLRYLIWPFVRTSFASSAVQVFSLCSMSFGLVLLLGGGPPVQTLETAIYAQMRMGSMDLGGAAACAVWQLGITLVPWILLVVRFPFREAELPSLAPANAERRPSRGARGRILAAGLLFVCALPLVPYLPLVFGTRWSALREPDFFAFVRSSLKVSLEIAIGSAGVSTFTALAGILAAYRFPRVSTWLRILLSVPAGISVLVLGIGGWIAYGRWLDPFEGSLLAIIALQSTTLFPLALRMLWPVAESTQRTLLEAAWTAGASPIRAFWLIEGPRWRAPVLSACAITAGASLGEVAAVSLFYSERLMPLPLWVARLMGQYRFDEAQTVSAVLLLMSAGLITTTMIVGEARR